MNRFFPVAKFRLREELRQPCEIGFFFTGDNRGETGEVGELSGDRAELMLVPCFYGCFESIASALGSGLGGHFIDELFKGSFCWNTSTRGVRLFKKAELIKFRKPVADGGRADLQGVSIDEVLRANGLGRSDIFLQNKA